MTPDVINKLEVAFAYCYTDKEACLYAGISHQTLYNYQEKHPEFVERKETLRLTPNLAAKRELVNGVTGNLDQARWWATHKMGDDFAPKTKVEHSGTIDNPSSGVNEVEKKLTADFNQKIKEAIAAGHGKELPKTP